MISLVYKHLIPIVDVLNGMDMFKDLKGHFELKLESELSSASKFVLLEPTLLWYDDKGNQLYDMSLPSVDYEQPTPVNEEEAYKIALSIITTSLNIVAYEENPYETLRAQIKKRKMEYEQGIAESMEENAFMREDNEDIISQM